MEEKIIACIVTFNPCLNRLEKSIKKLKEQVDKIIIIDNGTNKFKQVENRIYKIFNDIKDLNFDIIINEYNRGIAYALNQGLKYAKDNKFKWILTMDQDSICSTNMIREFENYIKHKNIEDIVIICPQIIDERLNYESISNNNYNQNKELMATITSGSLTNVEIAIEIGGFYDELFIDYVDIEFSLRARLNGYRIVKINSAKLYHELGDSKDYNILGNKVIATNHNYIRRYYFFRNGIYTDKIYIRKFPKWILRDILRKIKILCVITLFEKDKLRKIKYSLLGITDGLKNKLGKLNLEE